MLLKLFRYLFFLRLRWQWRKDHKLRLYYAAICSPRLYHSKQNMYWRWWWLDYTLMKLNSKAEPWNVFIDS